MARNEPLRLVTTRDIEILRALDHCPLTTLQLLAFSQTFEQPFSTERRLRERLQILSESGQVLRSPYATAGRGAPNYYLLTRRGYRILYGEEAQPPSKRAFQPIPVARQHHTQSNAAFIVATIAAAHRSGFRFTDFSRENSLRLDMGEECLYPDHAFTLIAPEGAEYRYFVEIDGGSERIRSPKDVDSWERKIRLYDSYQDRTLKRFRVLILTTRSTERHRHILSAANQLVKNAKRSLFYAAPLSQYVSQIEPLRSRCFLDHRGNPVSLLPRSRPMGRNLMPFRRPFAVA